jgi:hypothetical protein
MIIGAGIITGRRKGGGMIGRAGAGREKSFEAARPSCLERNRPLISIKEEIILI